MRAARSLLAVPATKRKMVEKALASDADGVLLDLEDAVAPNDKAGARAAGLRVLDGPVADYGDEEGLRNSCLVARSLGFDGKWCIHPAQIPVVNEAFSPTDEEVEWAESVIAAYEDANAAGFGSVSVYGQMVDAASIKMAQNILALTRQ